MTDAGEHGEFRTEAAPGPGRIDLVAAGREPLDALVAGLRGLISLALRDDPAALDATRQGTAAVPIRGRGGDLAETFARIAAETLGQLDDHGAGFAHVRIDGMLTADDGGYSAWGYLVGEPGWDPPPPLDLAGPVTAGTDPDGRILLRCAAVLGGVR
ncbi:MAG: hypothetical protein ACKOWF_07875 [Chloroflexota bacterium]